MCLADFTSSYISKKTGQLAIEPDEIKTYTALVFYNDYVKLNPNRIVFKNGLNEMWKHNQSCVIHFHKVFTLKNPKEYYWMNENKLKQHNQNYDGRYRG